MMQQEIHTALSRANRMLAGALMVRNSLYPGGRAYRQWGPRQGSAKSTGQPDTLKGDRR